MGARRRIAKGLAVAPAPALAREIVNANPSARRQPKLQTSARTRSDRWTRNARGRSVAGLIHTRTPTPTLTQNLTQVAVRVRMIGENETRELAGEFLAQRSSSETIALLTTWHLQLS